MINGDVSYWWRAIGRPAPRASLDGPMEADVCIVGAGYTGLWTAYALLRADPSLTVVVLEQRFAGYGASGRNGGWLTNEVTGGVASYRATDGPAAADAMQAALDDTVARVIRTAEEEGIDADIHLGGELTVARGAAQLGRLRAAASGTWLDVAALAERVRVAGAKGGTWQPHCARIHPAKLLVGLAAAVERLGGRILEDTTVTRIEPGRAVTAVGDVRARFVIRATEGFTAALPGAHRDWLPMNSSMVVTAPLPDDVWRAIGWAGAETLADAAHVYIYAQRTADGRIALGGRGVPYRWGSRIDADGATPRRTIDGLTRMLGSLFPALRDLPGGVPVDHAWSGVLGVPRDWRPTVGLDRATGLGWAGGYVGTGVAAANLAGRTLRDLVLGEGTAITRLPWVHHRVRRWEPEPLRFVAVRGLYAAYRTADAMEARGSRRSPVAALADRITGR